MNHVGLHEILDAVAGLEHVLLEADVDTIRPLNMEDKDMTDYLADVKTYDPNADEAVVNKIVKYLGIALRNRDSALVSSSDPQELARVKSGWCAKKLGVDGADADAAIAATAKEMAADRSKSRVTFYYLVAKHLDKLETV